MELRLSLLFTVSVCLLLSRFVRTFQFRDHTTTLVIGTAPQSRLYNQQSNDVDEIVVPLVERSYPIIVGSHLLQSSELLLRCVHPAKKVLIVTNDVVAPLYLLQVQHALQQKGVDTSCVVLPDGEIYKTIDSVSVILDTALNEKLDRQSVFIALGGGVIGDLTGFAAAIYQRGVRCVQLPTTLLAMVDSSVGGKTGVNHIRGKNLIGTFHQPYAVLADIHTLHTLPQREFVSALSEVLKYGLLLRDRGEMFTFLEKQLNGILQRDYGLLREVVKRCCSAKAAIVVQDEKEQTDIRAVLNLGHTFAHAIETGLGYGAWLHGEAVATGILMAADLSCRQHRIHPDLVSRIENVLARCELPLRPPQTMTPNMFLQLMQRDKKVRNGQLRLILLNGEVGQAEATSNFDYAALQETLNYFCQSNDVGTR